MNVEGPTAIVLFSDPPGHRLPDTSTDRTDGPQYFRARFLAERSAATFATSPEARQRHQELARAYDRLARGSDSGGSR